MKKFSRLIRERGQSLMQCAMSGSMNPSSRRMVRTPSIALVAARCGIAAPSRTRRVTPSTGAVNATKVILTFAKNRLTCHKSRGAPRLLRLSLNSKFCAIIFCVAIYYLLVWYLLLTHFDLAQLVVSSLL